MKYLRRFCSLLLCCVLLLGVSSVGVNASGLATHKIYQYHKYPNIISGSGLTFVPNNGALEDKQHEFIIQDYPKTTTYTTVYRVSKLNDDVLLKSGKKANLSFNNVYFSVLMSSVSSTGAESNLQYITRPNAVYANVTYVDGSSKSFYDEVSFIVNSDKKSLNISFDFTPEKDVQNIAFFTVVNSLFSSYSATQGSSYVQVTVYSGEFNGDDKYQFNADIDDGVGGFLSSIIDWIKGIFEKLGQLPSLVWGAFESAINYIHQSLQIIINHVANIHSYIWGLFEGALDAIFTKIKDIFDTVVNGFLDVVSYLVFLWEELVQLPSTVWDLFEDGLTFLFVPSDDYINGIDDIAQIFMQEKFGALYEVANIALDSWETVKNSDKTNTVNFPEVTIKLPGNESFSFGGFDVLIVPNGFDFLANSIKTVTGIVCTVLCVNGLRKKYDEVMGG